MSTRAPQLPPGERLRRAGIAAWSIIGILACVAILGWLLFEVRVIFPPLILAFLIIFLLNPIVTRLERRGVPRALGAIGTYVVVLGGFTLLVIAIAPLVAAQVGEFQDQWPQFKVEIVEFVDGVAAGLEDRFGITVETSQVSCLLGVEDPVAEGPSCDRVIEEFRDVLGRQAGRITELGATVLEGVLIFVLAPLLALYLLIDLPHLQRDLLNLVPAQHRDEARDLGSKVVRTVGGFFRGQFFVAVIVGVLSAVGFRLVGLPFWLVIGAIAGFFNLIPLVGPFIGGAVGFFVGVMTAGVGLGLKAAIVELVVQQLDNHLISPQIMRRTVQLHPATVVLALLAGGTLAGFWGVLLGVPAVAVAKLLLGHVWTTRVLGEEVSPYSRARTPPSVVPAHGLAVPGAAWTPPRAPAAVEAPPPGGTGAPPADAPDPDPGLAAPGATAPADAPRDR
ncbi:MAG TPA: AI-2E family transporter [Actinomycetota bacterium]|nr:AI-2E family transporter [Actinomycetota bacterium]